MKLPAILLLAATGLCFAAEDSEVVADFRKKYDAWWDSLPPFLVNEGLPEGKPGEFPIQKLRLTQGELPLWEHATNLSL